jgi:hypothetical protein
VPQFKYVASGSYVIASDGTGVGEVGYQVSVTSRSWTGSVVFAQNIAPPGSVPSYVNVAYQDANTGTEFAAGTAITGTAAIIISPTVGDLIAIVTVTTGEVIINVNPATQGVTNRELRNAFVAAGYDTAGQDTTEAMLSVAVAGMLGQVLDVRAFGAKGDGVTDDTAAIQAAVDASSVTGIVYIPSGTYRLAGTVTIPASIGLVGDGVRRTFIAIDSGVTAFHFDLAFTDAAANGLVVSGISVRSAEAYGSYTGTAFRFTNMIRSHLSELEAYRCETGFAFDGESFSNHFDVCRSRECGTGWEWGGVALSNNNNTHTACVFGGFLYGIKATAKTYSHTFNNCDFSPGYALNGDGKSSFYWADVVTAQFNGGYSEGDNTQTPNQFEFNTVLSANGNVCFTGFSFRGRRDGAKTGSAVKVTGFASLLSANNVFNDFDICIEHASAGTVTFNEDKTAVVNTYYDATASTGNAHGFRAKNLLFYEASAEILRIEGDTQTIVASSNAWNVVAGSQVIKFGSSDPEGAVSGAIGSLYMRTDGAVQRTLHLKQTGTGNTGWVRFMPIQYGTTANRPSLFNTDASTVYWDSDVGALMAWTGSAWVQLAVV